jgi:hypothetical protein
LATTDLGKRGWSTSVVTDGQYLSAAHFRRVFERGDLSTPLAWGKLPEFTSDLHPREIYPAKSLEMDVYLRAFAV